MLSLQILCLHESGVEICRKLVQRQFLAKCIHALEITSYSELSSIPKLHQASQSSQEKPNIYGTNTQASACLSKASPVDSPKRPSRCQCELVDASGCQCSGNIALKHIVRVGVSAASRCQCFGNIALKQIVAADQAHRQPCLAF